MELYPTKDVSADATTDALWSHSCRFGTPLVIMTDYGSQFMNKTLEGFAARSGIRHHSSMPHSKEENGIVERANIDKECVTNWPQMICMTEKLLNLSVTRSLT